MIFTVLFTRAPVLLAGPVITTAMVLHAITKPRKQPQSPKRGAACMDACCTPLTHAHTHPPARSSARSKCSHDVYELSFHGAQSRNYGGSTAKRKTKQQPHNHSNNGSWIVGTCHRSPSAATHRTTSDHRIASLSRPTS